jgi:signal transduction histidine kinase/CheY-like chemotaxis protein
MDQHAKNRIGTGWNDLSLRRKGLVVIALPLAVLLVGLLCFYLVAQAERRQEQWVDHAFQVRSDLSRLLINLLNAETGERGYLLTRHTDFLEPYHAGLKALPDSIFLISRLIKDNPVEVEQFRDIQLHVRKRLEKLSRTMSLLAVPEGLSSPKTTEEMLEGKAEMDDLRQEIAQMDEKESHLMVERFAELSRVRNWSLAAFFGAGMFAVLVSVAAVLLFSQGIVRRMGLLDENTRLLSEGMPLLPSPARSDEIGRLEQGMEAASLLLAARGQALIQSQKMEIVGKLAGGIAHEFNSILTVIFGQSELLLKDLPRGGPLFKSATEIRKVAERAATLTRQLLAAGRKQILQPEILDLNSLLAGMESSWLHLLGPDVEVRITFAVGLKAVEAEAGQIEQVIQNMAMNAAQAMPRGGRLTFETANVSFLQESVGRDSELKPGDYVMLAIADTGVGMSVEMKAHMFEPFHSIPGGGQGPGLGLSASYGIIKQSGGHISVESEPARGATFKIYLPQVEKLVKTPVPRSVSTDLPHGTETILLVEDNPALRETAAILLERLGYTVLAAANGIEALNLKQQRNTGSIDLLFTDVVMPHMGGKELSDLVLAFSPHTRVLFASGYTGDSIVHQVVLNKGVALLQKPFTPSALAHKVREVLDQPDALETDTPQKTFQFVEATSGVLPS